MKKYCITDYGVRPGVSDLQTKEFQAVLDMCKQGGGIVSVPKGRYRVAALRMWSDTTLYLEAGAEIYGSDNCDDYEVYSIPPDVDMRSDMELITQYYGKPWETYRRAMISAYGEKNISVIGETGSVIDGVNCYDPDGEEGYRGPHIIFFTCCENVHLEGYTARHGGNFIHEANNCKNITMRRVTSLGGSDGIHLHCSENTLIESCLFKTGDDCIAGINIKNLHVQNCVLNTSCNLFRIGGVNINVENVYAYGPGYYPHRMTVVRGKNDELPRESGRHNLMCVVDYFASMNYPFEPSDIHFKNCVVENADALIYYRADSGPLCTGTYLKELTLENVRFVDLKKSSEPVATNDVPLTVKTKNVTVEFHESSEASELVSVTRDSKVTLVEE